MNIREDVNKIKSVFLSQAMKGIGLQATLPRPRRHQAQHCINISKNDQIMLEFYDAILRFKSRQQRKDKAIQTNQISSFLEALAKFLNALKYFIKIMIYSVGQQVQGRPKNKQIKFEAVSDLRIQNIKYDYDAVLKQRLEEWFKTDELESFRLNSLKKLLRLATIQEKIQDYMPYMMKLEQKSKQFQDRMHIIMKMLIVSMGNQPSKLMTELKQEKIRLCSQVIIHNLLKESNILLPHLQSFYTAVKEQTNRLIQLFMKECRSQAVNIPTFLRNYRRLHITSQEFKDFMKNIVKITAESNQQQILKLFSILLQDILQQRQNNTDIEYIFTICQWLHPLYFHILKQKLHNLLSKAQEIPKLRNRLHRRLTERGYALLLNLLQLAIKQWLNKDNWSIVIYNTFQSCQEQILNNFVPLIENFKEVEKLYLRIMLKHIKTSWNMELYQKILGRNYSINIVSLKEKEITLIQENVSVTLVNKTVYPKQWRQTKLEDVKTNNPDIIRIITKMQKYQKQRSNELKNVKIVHHKITVNYGGNQHILSLQQLLSLPSVDSDYDAFYPTIIREKQQTSQPRETEQYVLQARLIKHLKRTKKDTFQNICSVITVPEERVRLLLQNLIKKQYVSKENQLYVYQP